MNPNIDRWTLASVSKHLEDRRVGWNLWIQGQDRPAVKSNLVELRVQGPTYRQISRTWVNYDISVLLGLYRIIDSDAHGLARLKGAVKAILADGPIMVHKYGNTTGTDDESYVGCFVLRDDVDRPIDGVDLGQPDASIKEERATVEAHFRMVLDS